MEMNRAKKPTTTSFRLKCLPTDFYHLSTTPCAFFGGYLSVDTFGSFFFSWDTTNLSMGVGGRYYFWCLFFCHSFFNGLVYPFPRLLFCSYDSYVINHDLWERDIGYKHKFYFLQSVEVLEWFCVSHSTEQKLYWKQFRMVDKLSCPWANYLLAKDVYENTPLAIDIDDYIVDGVTDASICYCSLLHKSGFLSWNDIAMRESCSGRISCW